MNSHSFSLRSDRSLFGNVVTAVTASLRRSPSRDHVAALAASLAAELRTEQRAVELAIGLASLPRTERNAALLRAAHLFRGDWRTFGIADSLRRLTRPELFQAVIRELQSHADTSKVVPFPTPLYRALAQAA